MRTLKASIEKPNTIAECFSDWYLDQGVERLLELRSIIQSQRAPYQAGLQEGWQRKWKIRRIH
ncbi:MAG: hypothetical protein CMF59_13900 [Leptospiraceae bacterium]|nr:hypothetical protein [Leptospiraceae bacterium]